MKKKATNRLAILATVLAGSAVVYIITSRIASAYSVIQAYNYLVRVNSEGYYEAWANNITQLVFGGKDNIGGVNGSDARLVIEACVKALPNKKGTILVAPGHFIITKGDIVGGANFYRGCTVDSQSDVTISGSGSGTVFTQAGPLQRTFSLINAPHCRLTNFMVDGEEIEANQSPEASDALIAVDQGSHFSVVDHIISANGLNADGIGSFGTEGVVLEDNEVYNNEHGIVLTASTKGSIHNNRIHDSHTDGALIFGYDWCTENSISLNKIWNCAVNGIEVSSIFRDSVNPPSYCSIVNNDVSFCQRGIVVTGASNTINNNLVTGCDLDALWLAGQNTANTPMGCVNNIVTNNRFMNSVNGWGIKEEAGAGYNQIEINIVRFNGAGAISPNGTTSTISRNEGYVTENGGTVEIPADGTSIIVQHGCDYTPIWEDISIGLLNKTENDIGNYWFDTITATTFTIHCDNPPGISNAYFKWTVERAHTYRVRLDESYRMRLNEWLKSGKLMLEFQ